MKVAVVYIAAEGRAGFGNRLTAAAQELGVDLRAMQGFCYNKTLRLLDEGSVSRMISSLREALPGHKILLVMDTLAQMIAGDGNENDSVTMQRLVASCQRIIDALGATVILVHHDTKNGEASLRGHSSLLGAVDVALYLKNLSDGHVELSTLKNKEADGDQAFVFELDARSIGYDEDGEEISAPVMRFVCQGSGSPDKHGGRKLHVNDEVVLRVLSDAGPAGLDPDELKTRIVTAGSIEGAKVPRAIENAILKLTKNGLVANQNGRLSAV